MKSNFKATTLAWSLASFMLAFNLIFGSSVSMMAKGNETQTNTNKIAAEKAASAAPAGRVVPGSTGYKLPASGWGVVSTKGGLNSIGRRSNGDFVIAVINGGIRVDTPEVSYIRSLALKEGSVIIAGPFVSDDGEFVTAAVMDHSNRPGRSFYRHNMAVVWKISAADKDGKVPVFAILEKCEPRGIRIVQGQPCVFGNYWEEDGLGFLWKPISGELIKFGGGYLTVNDINEGGTWVGSTSHPSAITGVGGSFSTLPANPDGALAFQISKSGKRIVGVNSTNQLLIWEGNAPPALVQYANAPIRPGRICGVTESKVVTLGSFNSPGFVHEKSEGLVLPLPEYLTKHGILNVSGERIDGFFKDAQGICILITNRRLLQIGKEVN